MKKIQITILSIFLLFPNVVNSLIEVDITRGNLNPLPVAVSPLFSDEKAMSLWLKQKNLKGDLHLKSGSFIHKLSHISFTFKVRLFEVKSNKKLILSDDNWYNLSDIEYGTPKFQEKILSLFKH